MRAKTTKQLITEIDELKREHKLSDKELAIMLGVSHSLISALRTGRMSISPKLQAALYTLKTGRPIKLERIKSTNNTPSPPMGWVRVPVAAHLYNEKVGIIYSRIKTGLLPFYRHGHDAILVPPPDTDAPTPLTPVTEPQPATKRHAPMRPPVKRVGSMPAANGVLYLLAAILVVSIALTIAVFILRGL